MNNEQISCCVPFQGEEEDPAKIAALLILMGFVAEMNNPDEQDDRPTDAE